RLAEMNMLSAAYLMNEGDTEEVRAEARDTFKLMSEALYGAPDEEIFTSLADREFTPLLSGEFENEAARALQVELGELLGEITPASRELFAASDEQIEAIRGLVTDRFEDLVAHVEDDKIYTR